VLAFSTPVSTSLRFHPLPERPRLRFVDVLDQPTDLHVRWQSFSPVAYLGPHYSETLAVLTGPAASMAA
jgi:hypothetical protein